MAHRIVQARWSMKLVKYYVGTPLFAYANGGTNTTVKQGGTFNVGLVVTPYSFEPSYEGLVETDRTFIAPNGVLSAKGLWDHWFDETGNVAVTVDPGVPPGQYTVRFRPWPRQSGSSKEYTIDPDVTRKQPIPWSNEITVTVVPAT